MNREIIVFNNEDLIPNGKLKSIVLISFQTDLNFFLQFGDGISFKLNKRMLVVPSTTAKTSVVLLLSSLTHERLYKTIPNIFFHSKLNNKNTLTLILPRYNKSEGPVRLDALLFVSYCYYIQVAHVLPIDIYGTL